MKNILTKLGKIIKTNNKIKLFPKIIYPDPTFVLDVFLKNMMHTEMIQIKI